MKKIYMINGNASNDDIIAWKNVNDHDLWLFDKLIVSKRMGYICGPTGVPVPKSDYYIVRPCVNLQGMGIEAKFQYIENDTNHLPPGHFWCEIFKGRHLSIDYEFGNQILAVEGFREENESIWRWNCWKKINDILPISEPLKNLNEYEKINIEYIDGHVIEIHLRHNPDFIYGNSVAYPVWKDKELTLNTDGLRFVESHDYYRLGFYID